MINSATASKEDEDLIKQAQKAGMLQSPGMAAATLTAAQADAMKAAAGNSGGATLGFMNMNMAQQAGGLNAQALYQMQAQQQVQPQPAPALRLYRKMLTAGHVHVVRKIPVNSV